MATASILDSGGKVIGSVADLVLDTREDRIAYISIRLSPNDGDRPARVTLPWSIVSVDPADSARLRVAVRGGTLRRIASKNDGRSR